MKNRRQNQNT